MENRPLDIEKALLHQISCGDQKAFAVIFKHYSKFIYPFALKLTRSTNVAEEIVQEVFLKIWVNRVNLGEIENFGAYLNRITRNHAYNVLRKIANEALASNELGKYITEEANDTENVINYRDTDQLLNKAIAKLTPQQKQVYMLCHQEGLKYSEVAGRLNISTSTVHSHMKQALHTIRSYFIRASLIFILFYF